MDVCCAATDPGSEVVAYFEGVYEEADLGLKLLALLGGGTRNFSNNERAIEGPDDIDGLKMRVPGSQLDARMWKSFGAHTTSLTWTERNTGAQTGVVDAFESPVSGYYGSKLYEVAPDRACTQHQMMMSQCPSSDNLGHRMP